MTGQTDEDIPETGAVFTFGKSRFADNVPSTFWLKNDNPVQISCGGEHTAVVTENGRLLVFGDNTWSQLGLGLKPAVTKPVSVKVLKYEKVKLAACGTAHTIVCTGRDGVYAVGDNQQGQLGLGHCSHATSFHQLRPFCDHAPIKMLSAGYNTSAALTEDGRLFMWGDNSVGQIGLGGERFAAQPRQLDVGEAVIWVSCGYHHSAFVTVDGDLYTFGEAAYGRLGLHVDQLANHRVPQRVQGIPGPVTQVSCGGEHTVALSDENVYTFGRGQYGQLGHGTFIFEVDLPKPLEHFFNSNIRHIASGENHTAIITDSGLLYTFGDGRHGKLGLAEENFINQFSPTLSARLSKYNVELVSCGGNHTLVLAAPRLLENQDVSEKDVRIRESCTQIPLLDTLIGPSSPVPLSALHARARHREKEISAELFGKMFQSLPRLHSGFLNTSWQASRNTSNNNTTPSSSPKPQSDITPSSPLSPGSLSKSPRTPLFSSAPSSPRSPLSNIASKSKPKELPPSLLSLKSIAKYNTVASQRKRKKKQNDKEPSAQSPVEPCSPNRPPTHVSNKHAGEEEHPASPQTGGEAVERQMNTEDVKETRVNATVLLDMERKRGRTSRKNTKEAGKLHSKKKTGQVSHRALPTELLKVSSSLKKEMKSTEKKPKVTSRGKENITKTQEHKQVHKEDKSSKHSKMHQEEFNPKNAQSVQKILTEAQPNLTEVKVSANKNKNVKDSNTSPDNEDRSSKTSFMGPTEDKKIKPTALDNKSSVTEATNHNKKPNISMQTGKSAPAGGATKEKGASKRTDRKTGESMIHQKLQEVKSTPTKDRPKGKSIMDKGQSRTRNVKSPDVKTETTRVRDETSKRVKSTPLKVKGQAQPVKPKPGKSEREETAKSRKEEVTVNKDLKLAKNTSEKMKGKPADEQKLPGVDSIKTEGQKKSKESDLKGKTKPEGEESQEIKMKREAIADRGDKKPKVKSKQTEASRLQVSQSNKLESNPDSPQSSKRAKLGSEPAEGDLLVSESDKEDTKEKPRYGELLTNVTTLLPAVGLAGAAVGMISDAVTSLQSLQSDNDSATSASPGVFKQKQIRKQSAIMQPSFSSTMSDWSLTESSDPPRQSGGEAAHASVGSKSGNEGQEEESDVAARDESQQEAVRSYQSEQTEDEDERKSSPDGETSLREEEEDAEGAGYGEDEGEETDQEDEEQVEEEEAQSGSDVEDEEGDSDSSVHDEEKSDSEEGEEAPQSETDDEGEEEESEESSDERADSETNSEVNEAEDEEEGSESEKASVAGSDEEEDEAEMSEDEEDESSEESGSTAGSKNGDSEEEDTEGSRSSQAESGDGEEEEEEEENDDEEDKFKKLKSDNTESEDEEKASEEEEETAEDEEENESVVEEEEESDEEEGEDEGSDTESETEGGSEGESSEENEEEKGETEDVTEEGEEEDKEDLTEEEEEGEEEEEEENEDEEEAEKDNEGAEDEEVTGEEEEEEDAAEEEEEDNEGADDEDVTEEEEEEEVAAEEEEEDNELAEKEEKEELDEDEEDTAGDEEEEEEEEESEGDKNQQTGKEKNKEHYKKTIVENVEEEEEDESDEDEEDDNGIVIKPKTDIRLQNEREERMEAKNLAESEDEEEEEEEESEEEEVNRKVEQGRKRVDEEEGEQTEEVEEEDEEGDQEEEEDGDGDDEEEEEEEEEEEGEDNVAPKRNPPQRSPLGQKQQQKTKPKPAQRTRRGASGESQQFWTDVLPQYLDLQ